MIHRPPELSLSLIQQLYAPQMNPSHVQVLDIGVWREGFGQTQYGIQIGLHRFNEDVPAGVTCDLCKFVDIHVCNGIVEGKGLRAEGDE